MSAPTKRDLRAAADRRAAAGWVEPTKLTPLAHGRNRAERRANASRRGVPGMSGPRVLHDHVVREVTAMVAHHPVYAAAFDDPDHAGTLYGIAVRRLADRRNDRRRTARRAQRAARRITRRRG